MLSRASGGFWGTVLGSFVAVAPAIAQTVAPVIVPAGDGTGTVVQVQNGEFEITGGTRSSDGRNLFHNFERFGLEAGQGASFWVTPELRHVLGQVTGGEASRINGTLRVVGGSANLYLLNPAGIVFGPQAQVDVPGSFTAATATAMGFGAGDWWGAIAPGAFPSGDPLAYRFDGSAPGSVVNFGALTVGTGASLTLLGGNVLNFGSLVAPGGEVTAAAIAGNSVARLGRSGGLLTLEVSPIAVADRWTGTGAIPPLALPELLTGAGLENATHLSVTETGQVILTASGVAVPDGTGTAIASGEIDTSRSGSGATVPQVSIFGDRVGLFGAVIAATAPETGGIVRIGGGFQGADPVPNSLVTLVDRASTVDVSAIGMGDGGQAIVWADDTTRFQGTAIARGGANGGNGGLIETSGKRFLDVAGSAIDASATNGLPGTWLLDPTDIRIETVSLTPSEGTFSGGNPSVLGFSDPAPDETIILVDDITSRLNAGTSVTISTVSAASGAGNIVVNAPIVVSPSTSVTLSLEANRSITIPNSIQSNGSPLNLILRGDIDQIDGGFVEIGNSEIRTNGGNLLATGSNIFITSEASIDAGGGNIEIRGKSLNQAPGVHLFNGSLSTTGSGNIRIEGEGGFGDIEDSNNYGVYITGETGSSLIISIENGIIEIIGKGGQGGRNSGIRISATSTTTLEILGSGTLILEGQSGISSSPSAGVHLDRVIVDSPNGSVEIIGIADSDNSTIQNRGVFIDQDNRISASSITVQGSSLTGSSNSQGVFLDSSSLLRATGIGGLNIEGETSGTGIGVSIAGELSVGMTDAPIIIDGESMGSVAVSINRPIEAFSYPITITGNSGINTQAIAGGQVNISADGSILMAGAVSESVCLGATMCAKGNLTIQGQNNVTTGPVFALNISMGSTEGRVTVGGTLTDAGGTCQGAGICAERNITLDSAANVFTGPIRSINGGLTATSTDGTIQVGGAIAAGDCQGASICTQNDINITGDLGISSGPIFTRNGALQITSESADITIGNRLPVGSDCGGSSLCILGSGDMAITGQTGIVSGPAIAGGGSINFTSESGNIRIFGTNTLDDCTGSSLCTQGGAAIAIQHGGLNDFIVGNPSSNGTAGTIFNGITTLQNLTILNRPGTYQNANLSVTPGFIAPPPTPPTPSPETAPSTSPTTPPTAPEGTDPPTTGEGDTSDRTIPSPPAPSPAPDTSPSPINPTVTPSPSPVDEFVGPPLSPPPPLPPVPPSPAPVEPTVTTTTTTTTDPSPAPEPPRRIISREDAIAFLRDLETIEGSTSALLDSYLGTDRVLRDVTLLPEGGFGLEFELPADLTLGNILERIRIHGLDIIEEVDRDLREAVALSPTGSDLVSLDRFFESLEKAQLETRIGIPVREIQVLYFAIQKNFEATYGEPVSNEFRAPWLVDWLTTTLDRASEFDLVALGNPSTALVTFINQVRNAMGESPIAITIAVREGDTVAVRSANTQTADYDAATSSPLSPPSPTEVARSTPAPTPTPIASPTPSPAPAPEPTPTTTPTPTASPLTETAPNPTTTTIRTVDNLRPEPTVMTPPEWFELDRSFTQQYVGADAIALAEGAGDLTLESLKNALNRSEIATGIQTGLVYVQFVPDGSSNPLDPDTHQLVLSLATGHGNPIRQPVPGVTRADAIAAASELRASITNPLERTSTSYLPSAQRLYKWLLEPLAATFETTGVENLVFVMDWGLKALPIAALHDGERFLIERYGVGQIPSMALIYADADQPVADLRDARTRTLAMGASEFETLPPLPFVPLELEAVARDRGNILLNEAFTLSNLQRERTTNPSEIVHIATHAEFRGSDSGQSFIQLWGNERLPVEDLRQLRLDSPQVELLVLSACRTALGDRNAELGFAGLSVNAGVKTAIASLWYVDDAGTLGLMDQFYDRLRSAPTKSEALRQAQLALLQGQGQHKTANAPFQHPYYWSSFLVIGTPW